MSSLMHVQPLVIAIPLDALTVFLNAISMSIVQDISWYHYKLQRYDRITIIALILCLAIASFFFHHYKAVPIAHKKKHIDNHTEHPHDLLYYQCSTVLSIILTIQLV